jgi:hypothetical protein
MTASAATGAVQLGDGDNFVVVGYALDPGDCVPLGEKTIGGVHATQLGIIPTCGILRPAKT